MQSPIAIEQFVTESFKDTGGVLFRLFGSLAIATIIASVALALLLPFIRKRTAPEN